MEGLVRAVKELGQGAEGLAHPAGRDAHPADPGAAAHHAERTATYSESFADPSRPVDDLLDSTFASRYVSQPMAKDRRAGGGGGEGGGAKVRKAGRVIGSQGRQGGHAQTAIYLWCAFFCAGCRMTARQRMWSTR